MGTRNTHLLYVGTLQQQKRIMQDRHSTQHMHSSLASRMLRSKGCSRCFTSLQGPIYLNSRRVLLPCLTKKEERPSIRLCSINMLQQVMRTIIPCGWTALPRLACADRCSSNLVVRPTSLHVQAGCGANVPLDQLLASLHLGEQRRISNDSRRILHLPASLVQACDDPDNGSFQHICQIRDS